MLTEGTDTLTDFGLRHADHDLVVGAYLHEKSDLSAIGVLGAVAGPMHRGKSEQEAAAGRQTPDQQPAPAEIDGLVDLPPPPHDGLPASSPAARWIALRMRT
jgi:hypothetical protein